MALSIRPLAITESKTAGPWLASATGLNAQANDLVRLQSLSVADFIGHVHQTVADSIRSGLRPPIRVMKNGVSHPFFAGSTPNIPRIQIPIPEHWTSTGTVMDALEQARDNGYTTIFYESQNVIPAAAAAGAVVRTQTGRDMRLVAFLTPAKSHGLKAHRDGESTFIIPSAGTKRWTISGGPCDGAPIASVTPPDEAEARLLLGDNPQSFEMTPGDFLWLPSGWTHLAENNRPGSTLHFTLMETAESMYNFRAPLVQHLAQRIEHMEKPTGADSIELEMFNAFLRIHGRPATLDDYASASKALRTAHQQVHDDPSVVSQIALDRLADKEAELGCAGVAAINTGQAKNVVYPYVGGSRTDVV